jgi:hypothetical protein
MCTPGKVTYSGSAASIKRQSCLDYKDFDGNQVRDRDINSHLSQVAKYVLNWLQQLTNWLLVIDNLDDVSVINGFLPSTDSNGHTLITTRNPNTEGIAAQGVEAGVFGCRCRN